MTKTNDSAQGYKVDTHVHLHPGFDLATALDAAATHMDLHASGPAGVLMLTEMAGVDRFGELAGQIGAWQIAPAEDVSVHARHSDGRQIYIIAGRQIVTADGLEVLALGLRTPIADGSPLDTTMAQVVDAGALAVLPWGLGKWTGARGAKIAALASAAPAHPHYCLADSGVRRAGSARPAVLTKAQTGAQTGADVRGWPVLAGTDPLPVAGADAQVGRFGCVVTADLDPAHPFASLRPALVDPLRPLPTYGHLETTGRFVINQVTMQTRKRLRR